MISGESMQCGIIPTFKVEGSVYRISGQHILKAVKAIDIPIFFLRKRHLLAAGSNVSQILTSLKG